MSGAAVPVLNSTVYQDNPYHALLYGALGGRYDCLRGSVDEAFQLLGDGAPALLHLHWEEHVLRGIPSAAEARLAARYVAGRIEAFRHRGGRVAWTVHNAAPHEGEHLDAFLDLRRAIASLADRVLVHGTDALALLEGQVGPVAHKAFYLPHPSYLGLYEPEEASLAGAARAPSRLLLAFGKVRGYKRLDRLAERLPERWLADLGAELRIAGEAAEGDPAGAALAAQLAGRATVSWHDDRVPEAAIGPLFRSARAAVMEYAQPLSSGVALLALGFGVPLVAPRLPGLLELVPAAAQGLLFTPDSAEDLQRAAAEVLALDEAAYAGIAGACLDRARYLHPRRISRLLGGVYDELRGLAS